ncbi:EamA family transporter RarD [Citricoccus sp. SGAir0253]|uniref:EamA family transporter RarD n=1 Tax=Citricoccus sp. SGAir0253 TaxID=2567881 RepID=UPI0010CD038C|nr:EamA family transporter RarD [Citricoccus sp. SGAir0253]QCU77404.1 EamA family transporter RarD [Citricoccus sp. SGAir0253]
MSRALDHRGARPANRPAPPARPVTPGGLAAGAGAYLLWGGLPLYVAATAPASAVEVVVVRIGFTLVTCAVLLAATRRWRDVGALVGRPRRLGATALAAVLIGANWAIYTYAVVSGQTIEAALGYFINPLVAVLAGVFLLGERLRPAQWAAVGISVVAVLVLAVGHGAVPWIGLGLALSFGSYGIAKNRLGPVNPVASLTAETIVLLPALVAGTWWLAATAQLTLVTGGPGHFWVLALSGPVTAAPLILFGAAAGRLPLTVVGMLQYLTPVIQFLVGLLVFGEHMTPGRWAGFVLIWCALAVLSVDSLRVARRQPR